MARCRFLRSLRVLALALSCGCAVSIVQAQGVKQIVPQNPVPDSDADHTKERNEWFFRGRLVRGMSSADLRRRAYQAKLQMRAQHAAALATAHVTGQLGLSLGSWTPLGPMPLASDASGNGTQDYHQGSGRATAIAIDPADPTGNTIYIGGAQSGVWKSTNAANNTAGSVTWSAVTDDEATLSIGALAIQPGNADPTKTVILAATGEADNSGDSYFGLGILRSADSGATWTLIRSANSGALSFAGLGGTRMAFSTAGQMRTVVAAIATTSEGVVDGAVTTAPGADSTPRSIADRHGLTMRCCGGTVVLGPAEQGVGVSRVLGKADELGHRSQILVEIVELIGARARARAFDHPRHL